MALSDFRPERREVKFKGGSFSVRGLTLDDISRLIAVHYDDLGRLVELYEEFSQQTFQRLSTDQFVLKLTKDAPALVGSIITLAADEADDPQAEAAARQLPFPTLVEALLAVGKLTFEEAGGWKRFLETCGSLLGGALPQQTRDRLGLPPQKAAA